MKKPARTATKKEVAATRIVQLELPTPEALKGALFGLVVEAGLASVAAMLEEDRVSLCGPRYRHDAARTASRAGHAKGELALGGRRVAVRRPRVRDREGREVRLPTWRRSKGTIRSRIGRSSRCSSE